MLAALNTRGGASGRNASFRLVSQHPGQWWLIRVLLLLTLVLAGGLGYWLGASRAALDTSYLQSLIRRDRAGEEVLAVLRQRLVDAELARAVDREAAASLRDTITSLRNEIAATRDEAALFRNMVSTSRRASGLRVSELEISPGEGAGAYRFYLLLSGPADAGELIRGTVELEVLGKESGRPQARSRVFALPRLGWTEAYPLPFRFRYFQSLSGELVLPVDFEPTRVLIRLRESGRRDPVRSELPWAPVGAP
jgi:hypothetical protein